MEHFDHWIGGGWQAPALGAYLDVATSPVTGETLTPIARGSKSDIVAAVKSAQAVQAGWASRPPSERGRILSAVADAIRGRLTEFAEAEAAQTGKTTASREVDLSAEYFTYYGATIRAFHGEVLGLGDGVTAYTKHEPIGVIGVITPWNAPLNQAARDVAPALAAGNAVVLKPSEFTSFTSLMLAETAVAAGLPAGLLNVVTGTGSEAGAALVQADGIGKVAFTGSVATGKLIGAAAGARLIPVTLELGGKSANIVFADANLDRAAAHVAMGFTQNAGQVCSAPTRLVVHADIHDSLVDRVAATVDGLQAGSQLGPMITAAQFDKVRSYFEIAKSEKATLRTGGSALCDEAEKGRYVRPTIFTDVRPNMRIAQEEIFGPVLSVLRFETEDEAIAIANGTEYGLAASVWTSDTGRALRVANQLQAGQVSVNGAALGNEAPFGGYKSSGLGRVKGHEALLTYTQVKTIGISTVS